jgi:hypothetical protein
MEDIVLSKMKQLGVEPTRKNYLDFAYFGTPPDVLSAEEEAQLPSQFQGKEEATEAAPDNPTDWVDQFHNSIKN